MFFFLVLILVCVGFLAAVGVLLLMHLLVWSRPGSSRRVELRDEGYRRAMLTDLEANEPAPSAADTGQIQAPGGIRPSSLDGPDQPNLRRGGI